MTKPLIYIAGPYTKPDPVLNTRHAVVAAERIEALGTDVFIPHLSLLWHLVSPAPYERWCERDNAVLDRCDALFRIPGESVGADAEEERARRLGMPVFSVGDHKAMARWIDFATGCIESDHVRWIATRRGWGEAGDGGLVPPREAKAS